MSMMLKSSQAESRAARRTYARNAERLRSSILGVPRRAVRDLTRCSAQQQVCRIVDLWCLLQFSEMSVGCVERIRTSFEIILNESEFVDLSFYIKCNESGTRNDFDTSNLLPASEVGLDIHSLFPFVTAL